MKKLTTHVLWMFAIIYLTCGTELRQKHDLKKSDSISHLSTQSETEDAKDSKDSRIETEEVPCPDQQDIWPCLCFYDEFSYDVTINCTWATTEEELRNCFAQPFPQNNMHSFTIDHQYINSTIEHLDSGVFGTKTFRYLDLRNLNFDISLDNFDHMNATLISINIVSAPYYEFDHNFDYYSRLDAIHLHECPLLEFSVSSPTVTSLALHYTWLTERDDGMPYVLGNMPNLKKLYITYANLTHLPETVGLINLKLIDVLENHISIIDPTYQTNSLLAYFRAWNNSIQDFPVGSFKMEEDSYFDMDSNFLTKLEEEKWKNVFQNSSRIVLLNNPFSCSCEIAWIFGNDTNGIPFMDKLYGDTTCENGTLFADLDQDSYSNC